VIIPEHKKAITTIMARRHPDGEVTAAPMKPEMVKGEDGEVDGRHVAAQDIMAAFHEKSPEKLMHALANFHDLHAAHQAKEPEAEE
jgi:hypothetical protein